MARKTYYVTQFQGQRGVLCCLAGMIEASTEDLTCVSVEDLRGWAKGRRFQPKRRVLTSDGFRYVDCRWSEVTGYLPEWHTPQDQLVTDEFSAQLSGKDLSNIYFSRKDEHAVTAETV